MEGLVRECEAAHLDAIVHVEDHAPLSAVRRQHRGAAADADEGAEWGDAEGLLGWHEKELEKRAVEARRAAKRAARLGTIDEDGKGRGASNDEPDITF